MYNKSEIMKRAWELYKNDRANKWSRNLYRNFGEALKSAWATAKHEIKAEQEARANGMVKACELKIGDIIAVDGFGGYDDVSFTKTIVSIESYEINDNNHFAIEFEGYNAKVSLKADSFVKVVSLVTETIAA